jgi:hypothetical protein
MKPLIKKAISRAVRNDRVWKIVNATIVRIARYAERERNRAPYAVVQDAITTISPDLTVRHGVFRGMKYPTDTSAVTVLIPKLLGLYEREIQPALEAICSTPYTEIVNIGCAEGYYAVGLAMRIPGARVFAYDINKQALRLCRRMARMNHVSGRLTTGAFCDANTLNGIPLTGRALILSDCEGYEQELFTEETAPLLAGHDLLIEIHDFVHAGISSHIRKLFEATHAIEVFQSLDDAKKVELYDCHELEGFDLATRKILLAEHRPAIMEWFYLKARQT